MGRTFRRNPAKRRRDPDGAAFGITDHAAEQFHTRIAPGLTYARCRVECSILARTARLTERRTGAGEELWEATDGAPVRFVVVNEGGRRMCVTILPAEDKREDEVA